MPSDFAGAKVESLVMVVYPMIHEVQICSNIDIVFMKHMNKQR